MRRSLAQSFLQMFLLRMGVGVGEAAGGAPGQALISDYVPRERRARGLSTISLGAVAGLVGAGGNAGAVLAGFSRVPSTFRR